MGSPEFCSMLFLTSVYKSKHLKSYGSVTQQLDIDWIPSAFLLTSTVYRQMLPLYYILSIFLLIVYHGGKKE